MSKAREQSIVRKLNEDLCANPGERSDPLRFKGEVYAARPSARHLGEIGAALPDEGASNQTPKATEEKRRKILQVEYGYIFFDFHSRIKRRIIIEVREDIWSRRWGPNEDKAGNTHGHS